MKRYLLLFLLLCASAASAQTIADKLTTLNGIKLDIKAALASKNQTVGDDFSIYDDAVASISTDIPDVFPAGLEEDDAVLSDGISDILDTNERQIPGITYCGNGICLAYVWVTSGAAKVYRSTNYGATFASVYEPLSTVVNIIYRGSYCGDGIIVAVGGHATQKNVFRSTNYGSNWSPVSINSSDTYFYCSEYLGSNTVVVGTSGNGIIHLSTDRGVGFSTVYDSDKAIIYCIENLGNGKALAGAAGDSEGLFKTSDYGVTWTPVVTSFNASAVTSLAYCGNGRVLAGTSPTGCIYFSDDYGNTWDIATDTTETVIYALEYCENGITYAGTDPNGLILKSPSKGDAASWSQIKDTVAQQVACITYIGGSIALYGNGYPLNDGHGIIGRITVGKEEVKRW